jgi:hypothetical protein
MAVRLRGPVRAALEKAAQDDHDLPVSTKSAIIIEDWLVDHGYLPKPTTKR